MRWSALFVGLCTSWTWAELEAGPLVVVRKGAFDVFYDVNEDAIPLRRVQLFFKRTDEENWQEYGSDEDRQPPIPFHASGEGQYEFFVVLTNETGPSSPAPTVSTEPHITTLVDFGPPIVQLHNVRQASVTGQIVLQIQWSAVEANLAARPVQILFQHVGEEAWRTVSAEPLANSGRFDWRVPDSVHGLIAIKVSVVDEAGHRADSAAVSVEIAAPVRSAEGDGPATKTATNAAPGKNPLKPPLPVSAKSKERAERLEAEGIELHRAGLYVEAIAKLREAVKLDPSRTDALARTGELLLLLGDSDRALDAFNTALAQQPAMRAALRGAAQVYERRKDYKSAAERLRTILRYDPADAEAWMHLGDIAVFQGDQLLAREYYGRATKIDPKAVAVIDEAQRRLSLLAAAASPSSPPTNPKGF
jgi:Flp pilus assembly protein TadD